MLDDGPGRLIADGGDPLAAVAPLLADATAAASRSLGQAAWAKAGSRVMHRARAASTGFVVGFI